MIDAAAISALISAAAVVGALTTSTIVTWYVEASHLRSEVDARTPAEIRDDEKTQEFETRLRLLESRKEALLWVAIIQWVVVGVLLVTALVLALQTDRFTFAGAVVALMIALVVLPVGLAFKAGQSLNATKDEIES